MPGPAPVLGGDATVVGIEHRRLGAEDGHVAIEEQRGFVVDVARLQAAVARGQFDQVRDPPRVDAGGRPPAGDVGYRQLGRTRFVVATSGFVDRIVVQHRQRDFRRLPPAWSCGDVVVMPQHFLHVLEVVVRARRRRVGRFERGALFVWQVQRQRDSHRQGSVSIAMPPL